MTKLERVQGKGKTQTKYMWFGFGNYGGQPFQQIGGGYVRDPGPFEKLFKSAKEERSPASLFIYIVLGLVAVMLLVMVGAWIVSLFLA